MWFRFGHFFRSIKMQLSKFRSIASKSKRSHRARRAIVRSKKCPVQISKFSAGDFRIISRIFKNHTGKFSSLPKIPWNSCNFVQIRNFWCYATLLIIHVGFYYFEHFSWQYLHIISWKSLHFHNWNSPFTGENYGKSRFIKDFYGIHVRTDFRNSNIWFWKLR